MKRGIFSILMISMFLLSIEPVDATDYGKKWLNFDKVSQVAYVGGFAAGWGTGYIECINEVFDQFKALVPQHRLADAIRKTYEKYYKHHISQSEIMVIADQVTEFYKDPANRLIHWELLCTSARDKIKGASKEEIEKQLEKFRSFASGTYRTPTPPFHKKK
jgi:hypothetical protein